MSTARAHQQVFTAETVASMSPQKIAQTLQSKTATIATLQQQLDWFKRQILGRKSERFAPVPGAQQMHLGQMLGELPPVPDQPEADSSMPAHTRRKPRSDFADDTAAAPFFDESRVPMQVITVPNPEAQGLASEQYESSARRSAVAWRSARAASWCSSTCGL